MIITKDSMDPNNPQAPKPPADSLEAPSTVVESNPTPEVGDTVSPQTPDAVTPETPQAPVPPRKKRIAINFRGLNIYLLGFIVVVVIAAVVALFSYGLSRKASNPTSIQSQNLSQSQLQQLANGDVNVGSNNQVLNVAANAVFGNQVLVRQDLAVGGNLKGGGSLGLPGLTITGGSNVQLQSTKLTISGDSVIGGQLNVNKNLSVAGSSTFSGAVSVNQLTVQSLQLNGPLSLNVHLTLGGTTPSKTAGSALGSGGTVSVSGSDSSGSISINTGTSPSAGCFVTITFASAFNTTPHVMVTPIGSGAAGLAYYVNRSSSSFSVCTTTAPPANQSFGFDFVALD